MQRELAGRVKRAMQEGISKEHTEVKHRGQQRMSKDSRMKQRPASTQQQIQLAAARSKGIGIGQNPKTVWLFS